jgi:AraC-like DNA-binding protein
VDTEIPARCQVEAWVPTVPGITEVFHARIVDWAYPRHVHDTWAVLIVDDGAIRYDLDTRHCGAAGRAVTILPPGVAHDGRPAPGAWGFRKREIYLSPGFLPERLVGAAVDHTTIHDPALRTALAGLHDSLIRGEESLDGEARLALISDRIGTHLGASGPRAPAPEARVARQLRELLDGHLADPVSLGEAAALIGRSVPHLVRSFTREFGVSPHAYVIGRRIDAARRLLLQGAAPAEVAAAMGFYDQAHFTRHFRRHTSVTPARFARSHASAAARLWPDAGA